MPTFSNSARGLLLASLLCTAALSAQQTTSPPNPAGTSIQLDVVVTPRSGPPVAGLQQQDFTVLDNKVRQTIKTFHASGGSQAPIEVILLVDTVNLSYDRVAWERGEIDKFLRADGGRLAYPTTLAFFSDDGTQIQEGYSTNGVELSASLDHYAVGLRNIRRSSQYEGYDRFKLSITALHELAQREAARPGRKIILWVSPGWPLLSGPRIELDAKQQQQIFANIVGLSTQLRQGRITLYSIDPLGTSEGVGRDFYYQSFLKGVSKASQANFGDLGLQVLATQTGGLALNASNDVASLLHTCLADTEAYYELSFDPPPGDHRDEYHHLEVLVAKPGLSARTRQGYYSEP
jgi:VWFA-related protein